MMRVCMGMFFLFLIVPRAMADGCLADPVAINPNQVNSGFGKSRLLPQYHGIPHVHWGVDFQARNQANNKVGADLLAVDAGTVIGAGWWGSGYGNRIALRRDNGDIVIYSHLSSIEPRLKSGGGVGFRVDSSQTTPDIGNVRVGVGEKVGVAGGTAFHMGVNERAIHLHLEYTTGYRGVKLREMGGGSSDVATRSRYYRDVRAYMCKTYRAVDNSQIAGTGGKPSPSDPKNVSSPEQKDVASSIQPDVIEGERYGLPDAPPYDTYAGMSEAQIVESEATRRMMDTEWETNLLKWGNRGIWIEIARMDGVMLWLDERIRDKRAHIEAMQAMLLANKSNDYFIPEMRSSRQQLDRMSLARRVN